MRQPLTEINLMHAISSNTIGGRRKNRNQSRLRWAGAVLFLGLTASVCVAQEAKYAGTVGQYPDGSPGLNGNEGVTATEWYFKDTPLVVVNVPCPNTSVVIE